MDYADPESKEDLRRFLTIPKGIENGWEKLGCVCPYWIGGRDIVNRPENEFPLSRTEMPSFSWMRLRGSFHPARNKESKVRYRSDDEQSKAILRYASQTELTGFMKLRLWVEADGADDMDLLFTSKSSMSRAISSLRDAGHPCPGAQGMLRVSHRELDAESQLLINIPLPSPGTASSCWRDRQWTLKSGPWARSAQGQQLRLTIQGFGKSWMDNLLPGIRCLITIA